MADGRCQEGGQDNNGDNSAQNNGDNSAQNNANNSNNNDNSAEPDAGDEDAQDAEGPNNSQDPDLPDDNSENNGNNGNNSEPMGCRPVRDGVLTKEELPFQIGLRGNFKAAQDAAVDLVGTTDEDGGRVWDLSGDLPGDHLLLIEAQGVDDKWFAADFEGAGYAARLSDGEELLGVFRWEESELLLLGVVSPEGGLTQTSLTYDPPVPVLKLPLQEGDSWSVESRVTGLALGIVAFYDEDYTYEVDASGTLKTPYGEFPVLRVRAELTRTVNFFPTDTRTFLFLTECFGTVAQVVSNSNERVVEFEEAAELRRLSP
jgi:hypothetical protein